eukprot:187366_1
MGHPFSVLSTLFVLSATIHAKCINKPDEKSEFDCTTITSPSACEKAAECDYILPGLTGPEFSDGRFIKSLPPLEAITEYIGDSLYYAKLRTNMPSLYGVFLEPFKEENLKITAPPGGIDKNAPKTKSDDLPLLQYSRPKIEAEPFKQDRVNDLNKFTLSDVVSIAYIAWWDALTMNNDRFYFDSEIDGKLTKQNQNNMMLSTIRLDDGVDHLIYMPIDQGFARVLIASWFHWKGKKEVDFADEGWDELHKSWFSADESGWSEEWRKWYQTWVAKVDRARYFYSRNFQYFPSMDDELKKKLFHIIDVIWTAKGGHLCDDMGTSIVRIFENPSIIIEHIEHLLKDSKIKHSTNLGWTAVQNTIKKQIQACKDDSSGGFSSEMEHIEGEIARDPLILMKDFAFPSDEAVASGSTAAAGSIAKTDAKQMQYNDGLYLDIDSKGVGRDSDGHFDDGHYLRSYDEDAYTIPHSGHFLRYDDHNHYEPLIGGEYNAIDASGSGSSFLIGGLVGASSVVIIVLIFCLGLAFGMAIYWGYSQKRALNVQRKKGEMRNWIDDDEDRNEV